MAWKIRTEKREDLEMKIGRRNLEIKLEL